MPKTNQTNKTHKKITALYWIKQLWPAMMRLYNLVILFMVLQSKSSVTHKNILK